MTGGIGKQPDSRESNESDLEEGPQRYQQLILKNRTHISFAEIQDIQSKKVRVY